jgi:cytochrome c553
VVIIGGGWGGATAAKYVKAADPSLEVVLLEPNRRFVSCPFSNLVLSGLRTLDSLTMGYDGLRRRGVRILHESAIALEPDRRRVRIGEGYLEYDRCIVSPGIDFQWEQVEGLAEHHEIAAFFARQKAERTSIRSDGGAVARGREAAKACAVCHGAEGRGDKAKLIPSLAGQPPGYLRAQLLLLKADQRSPKDDTLKAVKALLKTIPDERLADLAAYYSSLNP